MSLRIIVLLFMVLTIGCTPHKVRKHMPSTETSFETEKEIMDRRAEMAKAYIAKHGDGPPPKSLQDQMRDYCLSSKRYRRYGGLEDCINEMRFQLLEKRLEEVRSNSSIPSR